MLKKLKIKKKKKKKEKEKKSKLWFGDINLKIEKHYLFLDTLVTVFVGSQIVAHTQIETGDEPNKPNTINL